MSGIASGFLKLIHDNQISDEELVFPTVNQLEEITLEDFTGNQYFVDASRPFLVMMLAWPLWIIFMIMAKRHCCTLLPCSKFRYTGVVSIGVLVVTSILILTFSYPGNRVMQDGLLRYVASNDVASEALSRLDVDLEALDDTIEPFVFLDPTCDFTAAVNNVSDIILLLNLEIETLELTIQQSIELSSEFSSATDKSADSIISSLEWFDVSYIFLTSLLGSTGIILLVGRIRVYNSRKEKKKEDDACGLACFGVVYSVGFAIVLAVWIIAAILSVPTYVGADLCIGDPSQNLQDGLRRTLGDSELDFCALNTSKVDSGERKLGNTVCYYAECRGNFFVVEQLNTTNFPEVASALLEILDEGLEGTNCTDELDVVIGMINGVTNLTSDFDVECEDLSPLFVEAIEGDLCDRIVAGTATISLIWGLSASLLMVAMILGLLNSKKTMKQRLRELQKKKKKKKKQEARARASINRGQGQSDIPEADEVDFETDYEQERVAQINKPITASPFLEEDDDVRGVTLDDLEADSLPDLDGTPQNRGRGRGSSFGIRF